MFKFRYDDEYDILDILIGDTSYSLGVEEEEGLIIFADVDTGKVTGAALIDFHKRMKAKELPLLPQSFLKRLNGRYENGCYLLDLPDSNIYVTEDTKEAAIIDLYKSIYYVWGHYINTSDEKLDPYDLGIKEWFEDSIH